MVVGWLLGGFRWLFGGSMVVVRWLHFDCMMAAIELETKSI